MTKKFNIEFSSTLQKLVSVELSEDVLKKLQQQMNMDSLPTYCGK